LPFDLNSLAWPIAIEARNITHNHTQSHTHTHTHTHTQSERHFLSWFAGRLPARQAVIN
jgi:hypothetical protein